jgi:hypothetical protein
MWDTIGPRELQLGVLFLDWLREQAVENGPGWLPSPLAIAKSSPFVQYGNGEEDMETLLGMMLWIRTARTAGGAGYDDHWLPGFPDLTKSSLFERIRRGVKPLPEPPPSVMSYPWYAVVEDPGPHHAQDACFDTGWLKENQVRVYQNIYEIVERLGEKHFIVKDGTHGTSYRFHLWYDPDSWRWFLQNTVFRESVDQSVSMLSSDLPAK